MQNKCYVAICTCMHLSTYCIDTSTRHGTLQLCLVMLLLAKADVVFKENDNSNLNLAV
ncbi:hypothetical protein L195_g010078, partial [Trifolium pratense]